MRFFTGWFVPAISAPLMVCSVVSAEILPLGVLDDEQTSIVYQPETGDIRIDPTAGKEIDALRITSQEGIFGGNIEWSGCGGPWTACVVDPHWLVIATGFGQLGTQSLGQIAEPELSNEFVLNDLTVEMLSYKPGGIDDGPVDLVYMQQLQPGDANRDFTFDQLDIVQVLQRAKYSTGKPATWGDGDWDGAPGGYPGKPPTGDGVFDQVDIAAALKTGAYIPVPPGPALLPGDADQDLDFDQYDLVQVLQRAKYLTGEYATWGDGDWNGAPGGGVGNPPQGDGQFNQLDIISAIDNYLCGSYYIDCRFPYAALTPHGEDVEIRGLPVFYQESGEHPADIGSSATEGTIIDIAFIPERCTSVLAGVLVISLLAFDRLRRRTSLKAPMTVVGPRESPSCGDHKT